MNYRTVQSFGEKNIKFLLSKYSQNLLLPQRIGIKKAHISGMFFGYSQSVRFAYIGFIFYMASVFVQKLGLDS